MNWGCVMDDKDKTKESTSREEPQAHLPGRHRGGWRVIRIGATFELSLVLAQNAFAVTPDFLPLGGGSLQQIGLCFGVAFVIAEFADLLRPP